MSYYQNTYGEVTLTPESAFMPISAINSGMVPEHCRLSLEDLEKVALITDNRGIQLCPAMPAGGYIVLHDGPQIAAIVSATIHSFRCTCSPQEKIARLAQNPTA